MTARLPLPYRAAVVALAALLALAAGPATGAETAGQTIERVLADRAYQRDLPTDPSVLQQGRSLCDIFPFLCGGEDKSATDEEPGETAPRKWQVETLDILLLILAVGAVGALIVVLAPRLGDLAARRNGDAAEDPRRPETTGTPEDAATGLLADADRLAAEGRFAEAIHLLLLCGIEDLRGRLGGALTPSLTGREIVRRTEMAAEARKALGRLTMATELCHFGGREPNAADYAGCRADFLQFQQAVGPATG